MEFLGTMSRKLGWNTKERKNEPIRTFRFIGKLRHTSPINEKGERANKIFCFLLPAADEGKNLSDAESMS